MVVVITLNTFTFLNNSNNNSDLLHLLLQVQQVEAINASPQPYDMKQPFGKTISLILRGNEVQHHEETIDGKYCNMKRKKKFLKQNI